MLGAKMLNVLLVEDNPGDARLAVEALREGGAKVQLHLAQDGVEAMAFLKREAPHGEAPRPDLLLLDLNLPRKDGREVLAEVKNDPSLRRIPVVVLTTSQAEQDVMSCYELHANCFITKPVDLDQFINVVKTIEGFWCQTVKLPPR